MTTLETIKRVWGIEIVVPGLPIELPGITRDDLARLFYTLGFTSGAEIGTQRGVFAETLCQSNPSLTLQCVDAWDAYPGLWGYGPKMVAEMDECYQEAITRLAKYNCVLHRAMSDEAARDFLDESLDFIYIDANHSFPWVVRDLHCWAPKVRSGGCIAGHDYKQFVKQRDSHVVEAVQGWTKAYRIDPWFVLGTKGDARRDEPRSFFWVKE